MSNKIILKKSSVTSKVPQTTDLDFGELALNYADGRLYFKKSDGTTIDFFTASATESAVIKLEHSDLSSNSVTTSSVSQVSVDSFPSATYRSAKYYVQMTSGSEYHVIEISLLHDGTDVNLVQYGEIRTGASLGTFDASISTGTLNLLFTPTNATTTIKLTRTAIKA